MAPMIQGVLIDEVQHGEDIPDCREPFTAVKVLRYHIE
jgi:hypothetical protein